MTHIFSDLPTLDNHGYFQGAKALECVSIPVLQNFRNAFLESASIYILIASKVQIWDYILAPGHSEILSV